MQQEEQEFKPYENAVLNLQEVLNSNHRNTAQDFLKCLLELKEFRAEISTKFLKNLMNCDTRKKSNRIRYLLNKNDLKLIKKNRFFKEWVFEKYKTDIKEFRHKKGLIYAEPLPYSEEEQARIKEIDEISKATGLKLCYHLEKHDEKQNIRNAINKADAVYLKEIRTEKISKSFIKNKREVLYFIQF